MVGELFGCEIVSVTTWPPPWPAGLSQQPLSSPKPWKPDPVKSLSSQVMTMTEFPVQARELMIAETVLCRNASPVAISDWTCEKSHGSAGVAARPRLSWGRAGGVQTKTGTAVLCRSAGHWLRSTLVGLRRAVDCTCR